MFVLTHDMPPACSSTTRCDKLFVRIKQRPCMGVCACGLGAQTAYANGASSAYIRGTLGLPVPLAKTGVKFVHHKAMEYDIGM